MGSTGSEHIEGVKGTGPIPPNQGIFEISSTQKAELGRRIAFEDGRVFRYAQAGASDLAAAVFVKAPGVESINATNKAVYAAVAAGNKSVTLETTAAITTCTDGYLCINDAAGEGHMYKIKTAAANATTATYTDLELYDPVVVALTTASEGTIVYNPWDGVTASAATYGENIVGVTPMAVTAEYYFWAQTWGLCTVLQAVDNAVGNVVCACSTGATFPGQDDTATGKYVEIRMNAPIGVQFGVVGVATEHRPIWLMIAP